MVDLHPVVIQPMEHVYKAVKYTCSGDGLAKDGYFYDSQAERFIPAKHEKPGAEPKEKKSVSWWKAQCAFRGLNQSGSITDLQIRLREAKKKMLPELKSTESELNKEFKKLNHAARANSWNSLKTDEAKAKANPRRYLLEQFPETGTGRPENLDIVVLKLNLKERLGVTAAAEELSLETVSVDAPWTSNKKPSPDRWTIIGRTRDAVWNQMRDTERETSRSRERYAQDRVQSSTPHATSLSSEPSQKPRKTASVRKPELIIGSTSKPRTKQTARKSAIPNYVHMDEKSVNKRKADLLEHPARNSMTNENMDEEVASVYPSAARKLASQGASFSCATTATTSQRKQTAKKRAYPDSDDEQQLKIKAEPSPRDNTQDRSWDVRGSWEISCPGIEQEWEPQGADPSLNLDIYLENKNGRQQLFAMFHFRVFEGIMRFEKPIPVPKSEVANGYPKKRKREDEDEEFEIEYDPSYEEKVFLLGAGDKPTARRPTWRYRWRGSETGEGEIQLGSDKYIQELTFKKKGSELSGTFRGTMGVYKFTGIKVQSRPHDGHIEPQAIWKNHDEQAYENARVSRW